MLRGGGPVRLQQQIIFGGRLTTTVVFWRSKLYITRIHTAVHVLLMWTVGHDALKVSV